MTKEEINRQVAEKVMGWDYDPLGGMLDDHKHPAWIMEDSSWIREEDWNPAERIDHAWMVVEKFEAFSLVRYKNKFYCEITEDRENGFPVYFGPPRECEADTAPMAICLAAIEAVKEKK